jgi:hypothetical protein
VGYLLLGALMVFFGIGLIPAALVRSRRSRITILLLVPLIGTVVLYIVFIELYQHGYLGGT